MAFNEYYTTALARGFGDVLSAANQKKHTNYPPYDVVKVTDTTFEIRIAAAGFEKENFSISVDGNKLTISGKMPQQVASEAVFYHSGIAKRDFSLAFTLEENVDASSAKFTNGILTVYLKFIPKEQKAQFIAVG